MTFIRTIIDEAVQGNFSFFILVGTVWTIALMYRKAQDRKDIRALLGELETAIAALTFAQPVKLEGDAATNFALAAELSGVTADRDRWKARTEALERALKTKLTACSTCAKKQPGGYCDELYGCINEDWDYPHWQFDQARFAGDAP